MNRSADAAFWCYFQFFPDLKMNFGKEIDDSLDHFVIFETMIY
jgi:hypothetical protein